MNRPFRIRFFILFIFLSAALVAFLDWQMFRDSADTSSQAEEAIEALIRPTVVEIEPASGSDEEYETAQYQEPILVMPDEGGEYFEEIIPEPVQEEVVNEQKHIKPAPMTGPAVVPGHPKISVIIDDIGMNISGSKEAVSLPAPLTIAILPYAEKAQEFASMAKEHGHELIIHTPMEAMSADVGLGSLALTSSLSEEEFQNEFDKILASFDGYVGINNHMGSKLTQDKEAMGRVMAKLKSHHLFFVDSRTIHTSVAAETAAEYGLPYAKRDVFLDHEDTAEYTQEALQKLERIATEKGSAIAIGHPKQVTIDALQVWIPDAKARGFEFVPVSALLRKEEPKKAAVITPQSLGSAVPAQAQSQPPG